MYFSKSCGETNLLELHLFPKRILLGCVGNATCFFRNQHTPSTSHTWILRTPKSRAFKMHIVPGVVKFPVNNSWCWCYVTDFKINHLMKMSPMFTRVPKCLPYHFLYVDSISSQVPGASPPWRRSCLAPACNVHSPVRSPWKNQKTTKTTKVTQIIFEKRNYLTYINTLKGSLKTNHMFCMLLRVNSLANFAMNCLGFFSRLFCTPTGLT